MGQTVEEPLQGTQAPSANEPVSKQRDRHNGSSTRTTERKGKRSRTQAEKIERTRKEREQRARMTEEQRLEFLRKKQQSTRERRLRLTDDQRKEIKQKNKQYAKRVRQGWTDEEWEENKRKKRETAKAKRQSMTATERARFSQRDRQNRVNRAQYLKVHDPDEYERQRRNKIEHGWRQRLELKHQRAQSTLKGPASPDPAGRKTSPPYRTMGREEGPGLPGQGAQITSDRFDQLAQSEAQLASVEPPGSDRRMGAPDQALSFLGRAYNEKFAGQRKDSLPPPPPPPPPSPAIHFGAPEAARAHDLEAASQQNAVEKWRQARRRTVQEAKWANLNSKVHGGKGGNPPRDAEKEDVGRKGSEIDGRYQQVLLQQKTQEIRMAEERAVDALTDMRRQRARRKPTAPSYQPRTLEEILGSDPMHQSGPVPAIDESREAAARAGRRRDKR